MTYLTNCFPCPSPILYLPDLMSSLRLACRTATSTYLPTHLPTHLPTISSSARHSQSNACKAGCVHELIRFFIRLPTQPKLSQIHYLRQSLAGGNLTIPIPYLTSITPASTFADRSCHSHHKYLNSFLPAFLACQPKSPTYILIHGTYPPA